MRQSWTDDRMDDLVKQVDSGFARVDQQFGRVDQRFLHVEKKIENMRAENREQFANLRAENRGQFEALNRRIDIYSIALITGALGIVAALIAS